MKKQKHNIQRNQRLFGYRKKELQLKKRLGSAVLEDLDSFNPPKCILGEARFCIIIQSSRFFPERGFHAVENGRPVGVYKPVSSNPWKAEALEIHRSRFVWTRLRPCSQPPFFAASTWLETEQKTQGWSMRGVRGRRALQELDLKVLHFDGTAERKHLSSANAPDCLCFPLSRGLLSHRAAQTVKIKEFGAHRIYLRMYVQFYMCITIDVR